MKKNKSKNFFTILSFLGIYLLSTGVSFAVFDYLKEPPQIIEESKTESVSKEDLLVDVSGPKTETCLLNGQKFTEAEKEAWSKRRPLAVMIENHEEARPQSGLSRADVVYEAVAEGGTTRFMALFYCDVVARETIVGPVRSARTYFLDWASEYGETPLYVHVGGAHCDLETKQGCLNGAKADALGQIREYGWEGENDFNQFSIGYPTFWRDYERLGRTVATEHTMYSTTERLWSVAKERGWTNKDPEGNNWQASFTPWQFKEEPTSQGEESTEIVFDFWEGYKNMEVKWLYQEEEGVYRRSNGEESHKDLNNQQQLEAKNIVVQFMKESPANDGYPGNVHLLYGTIGEGKALVFQDGRAIEAKWIKRNRKDRTKFYNSQGQEIKFNPGKIWIEIIPVEAEVSY